MIKLKNGVRVFVNHSMKKDIYIGISDFGFEKDIYDGILGIAHLLEHILISFDSKCFNANASTSRTYMSFWCQALKPCYYDYAIKTAIGWFFDKRGTLKTDFNDVNLENYITELENEYYYRTEMYHCMDILAYLYGGDLYNGGRITMLKNILEIKKILSDRMKRLSGKNIIIFVKKLKLNILSSIENTFGNIPLYPCSIPLQITSQNITNKIIMMPYPFYTLLIQVDNNINNVLAIICLVENYNLIDYETIDNKLYFSISLADEEQYEYFLYNIKRINFVIDKVTLDLGEDYIMNLYINFPWFKKDIFEYMYVITTQNKILVNDLKNNMYRSVLNNNFIIIYPSFTKSMYNLTDKQNHNLLVVDVNFKSKQHEFSYNPVRVLYKKISENNKVVISYNDDNFFKYVVFYHLIKYKYNTGKLVTKESSVYYKHCFNNNDISELINADTFVKYNRSKPSILYQYILLTYFVTEKTIKEILDDKSQLLQLDLRSVGSNKIVFTKNTRYDIYTRSTFVCGLIKGYKLNDKVITDYMWKLKNKGFLYFMNYIKLSLPNTYYVFMFTIFTEKVYDFFVKQEEISKYCLIVSNKNVSSDFDDYSSLNKNIIINIK